jgi:glycosyltransferase involved in cell wall biosynthesis
MQTLSVILITRNEEGHLKECLDSVVAIASEIIVVDSQSTDQTLQIAQQFRARIATPPDWPGFGPQKNRALTMATKEWVLSLDADERITLELLEEIKGVLANPQADCYAIPRRCFFFGRMINHSGWNPDYVNRLFRRGSARFSDDMIHEKLLFHDKVIKLSSNMLHHSFLDFSQVLQKVDRYSSDSARQAFLNQKNSSVYKALGHGLWAFIRTYLFKLGFLDGPHGLALAISNAEGSYYRYLKLWLMHEKAKREH